jgi:hypothetical protein
VSGRRVALLLGVLAVLVGGTIAAGVVLWAADGDGDEEVEAGGATLAADARELASLSRPVGHAVYWAGPLSGHRYELTQTSDGRAYVRYLPEGTEAGDPRPGFLTVGTYLLEDAFAVTRATSRRKDARAVRLPGGGVAFYTTARPQSVYVAFEGSDLQIEVFHPTPREARRLVTAGKVRAVG